MTSITLDQGFQFGLGAFETIAVEQGKTVFLKAHLERLEKAASFLGLGEIKQRGVTEEAVEKYLSEQKEELVHHGLKIMVSEKNVLFQIRSNPYHEKQYEKGFKMDFSMVRRNETSLLTGYKTMNYGDCILEKRAAACLGMDERIFLNTKGEIAEGTVSNLFFIRDGKLETPKEECGLLPGIVRDYLCETQEVKKTVIYPEDLDQYQECFVTNSLMGIMPVKSLGKKIFPKKEKTLEIRKAYLDGIFTGKSGISVV